MGMSSHIVGFKAPNEKWKKFKKIYDSCEEAGIDCPEEVYEFFGEEPPDPKGIVVELEESKAVKEYKADMIDGFEVELSKLPKDLTHIRFYNSF